MAELALSVDIDAPPEVVFDALTDWTGQHEWMAGTNVRVSSGDGRSVGSRILARTAAGPVGFDDPMEITGWERPKRVQVHHLGRVVRGDGVFEVEALPDGRSRFHWVEWIEVPLGTFGLVGFTLTRPVMARAILPSLRSFARWAERRAAG
ncbi:MAG TPA: SRPBCC family protein [Frankiaceae bacterium]|nr:SRPBCC family protein [Frankiaceae bacterium]